jgi:hypothetical protein
VSSPFTQKSDGPAGTSSTFPRIFTPGALPGLSGNDGRDRAVAATAAGRHPPLAVEGTSHGATGYARDMERPDPIISLIEEELESYQRPGRVAHLAHAARVLEEMGAGIAANGLSNGGAQRHVGASNHRD